MADSAVSLDKVKGFLYAQYNDEEKWALNVVGERRRLSFSAKTQHRNCGNGNGDPPLLLSETLAEGLDTSLISLSVPKLRRRGRVSSLFIFVSFGDDYHQWGGVFQQVRSVV
ncbi:hypothetical protein CsatB_026075 [Cannabis sativa]